MRCLHVALLVATAMMSLSAFATASQSDMTPWRPDESYAGKAQADSRLDKPVRFWGAGILLADVFSQVREQTGVEIGFYPENDENRRVPVHLFLNPKNPPTLRSLMAQLSWVVDCPFLAADSPEGRSYYLMSSSVGAGAQERLQKAVEEIWEARKGRWQAIGSKLDEYRQALDLPRDGLIDRYRSKDDLMLLNLLDPARRAATQFMCRHATAIQAPEMPGEQAGAGELEGFGQTVPSTDFTDDDITDLKAAFGLPDSVLRDPGMAFDIHVEAVGRLRVNAAPEYTQKAGRPSDGHFGPYLIADLTDGFALSTAG